MRTILDNLGGYILAGGRSSRMGTDKALLQLAGKPLIQHAVTKLQRICADVHILSSNPKLARYAPLVQDLHPNCGPIGGIEAALAHSTRPWNLILPVDIPFLPTAFLWARAGWTMRYEEAGVRMSMFTVFGVPQPALLLIHGDVAPYIGHAIAEGKYKLFAALESAALDIESGLDPAVREFAAREYGTPLRVLQNMQWEETGSFSAGLSDGEPWQALTLAQCAARPFWFANLNTPEEFAQVELHTDALDT